MRESERGRVRDAMRYRGQRGRKREGGMQDCAVLYCTVQTQHSHSDKRQHIFEHSITYYIVTDIDYTVYRTRVV